MTEHIRRGKSYKGNCNALQKYSAVMEELVKAPNWLKEVSSTRETLPSQDKAT